MLPLAGFQVGLWAVVIKLLFLKLYKENSKNWEYIKFKDLQYLEDWIFVNPLPHLEYEFSYQGQFLDPCFLPYLLLAINSRQTPPHPRLLYFLPILHFMIILFRSFCFLNFFPIQFYVFFSKLAESLLASYNLKINANRKNQF